MNLEKLSPAPWEVHDVEEAHTVCKVGPKGCKPLFERWDGSSDTTDAEFVCLARAAFDVMLRRGWGVVRCGDLWLLALPTMDLMDHLRSQRWLDPFTALVEGDRWYRENVEKRS